jgi:hypothetical protein
MNGPGQGAYAFRAKASRENIGAIDTCNHDFRFPTIGLSHVSSQVTAALDHTCAKKFTTQQLAHRLLISFTRTV